MLRIVPCVLLASTARRFHGWCVTQEAGRRRLLGLKVAAIPSHFTDDEHQRYMLGMVDMTHEHMVCAAGALLRYLETHRVGMELEDRDTPFTIATIQTLSLYVRACVGVLRDIAAVLMLRSFAMQCRHCAGRPGGIQVWQCRLHTRAGYTT
jgi:hypothetical protein